MTNHYYQIYNFLILAIKRKGKVEGTLLLIHLKDNMPATFSKILNFFSNTKTQRRVGKIHTFHKPKYALD